MHEAFKAIRFEDEGKVEQILGPMLEGRPVLAACLAERLQKLPSPDCAVVRLDRFLEANGPTQTPLDLMEGSPDYLHMLVTLLAQSHYLTDVLCRNPQYLSWLWEEVDLNETPPRSQQVDELLHQLRGFDVFEARRQSMRRFKRREILRIAARDLVAHASLAAVAEDLSNLADAALEAGIWCAEQEIQQRYGIPRQGDSSGQAAFCILAMGKLGGRELNFSSDIDLIFVHSREGETSGGASGSVTNEQYFQKLGEFIIKAVGEDTSEGHVFRVDMRLRPYGKGAPLSVNVDRAVDYYETVGRAWERQALIKTRPCAGDKALGEAFIERTRPFVFPRYFDDETLNEISEVKQQMEMYIEEKGETDREVKLGRGGIRDVEFTVQVLQLLNGGRIPELRITNTLATIAALGRHGVLRPLEADALSSNYIFMRRVEHQLQIKGSQQIHTLPSDPKELDAFAQYFGYSDRTAFTQDYRERAEETRKILERFLSVEGSGNRWIYDVLHPHGEGKAGLDALCRLGFATPERARDLLTLLYAGPGDRPSGMRVRQQFTAIAPPLLESMARCGDPDAVLMRLTDILTKLRAPASLYDILNNQPKLCEYLVTLVDNSTYLTNILMQEPGLFDTFGHPGALDKPNSREALDEELGALSGAYDSDPAIYRLHAGETLRIGMRDLFGGADVFEIGRELTTLAEVCTGYALRKAYEAIAGRFGHSTGSFAVIGLGKMGGRELGYGSDLDLVFVYSNDPEIDSGMSAYEYYAALAANLMKCLKERTRHGVLYDVDARLRPDGGKGVLAMSEARFEEYYSKDAQAWERLALVKAQPAAGDAEFCARLQGTARSLAFRRPFTADELDSIADVRERLAEKAGPLDLKKASGGIIEIEFILRLLQVQHAQEHPAIWRNDVRGTIDALIGVGLLSSGAAAELLQAYTLFRRVENRIRMAEGRSGSAMPNDENARADLARRLGIDGDLETLVNETKERVREHYEEVLTLLRAATQS